MLLTRIKIKSLIKNKHRFNKLTTIHNFITRQLLMKLALVFIKSSMKKEWQTMRKGRSTTNLISLPLLTSLPKKAVGINLSKNLAKSYRGRIWGLWRATTTAMN